MLSGRVWKKYYLTAKAQSLVKKIFIKCFRKKVSFVSKEIRQRLLSLEETQDVIRKMILDGKPAVISRFGSNEAWCTAEGIGVRLGKKRHFSPLVLRLMHFNAGLFPYGEKMAVRFSEISEEAASSVDLLGWWGSFMQEYLAKEVCKKDVLLTKLANLEPYYSETPWSSALKGKKVLVIHPFKESIEAQYQKREFLFSNPDMLPEFDLTVLKAVQTIAGEKDDRFDNWEQALNHMCEEALKVDFDIAIIGCGAYGMALATKLKAAGKIAIHLGGATQLLFGIKGSRWDNNLGKKLYNEHWTRPLESEVPTSANGVEKGCYW